MLRLKNFSISAKKKLILESLNLELESGKTYSLEGKNGSGKTSLAQSLIANPEFEVSGDLIYQNQKINDLDSTSRSLAGIFVSSSQPVELRGVSIISLLKTVAKTHLQAKGLELDLTDLLAKVKEIQIKLDLPDNFYKLDFGFGLSSGQKKKLEILQMLILEPKLVVLDEVDSGLDQKSQLNLIQILEEFRSPDRTFLVISHNPNFLQNLKVDQKLEIQNQQVQIKK